MSYLVAQSFIFCHNCIFKCLFKLSVCETMHKHEEANKRKTHNSESSCAFFIKRKKNTQKHIIKGDRKIKLQKMIDITQLVGYLCKVLHSRRSIM